MTDILNLFGLVVNKLSVIKLPLFNVDIGSLVGGCLLILVLSLIFIGFLKSR